MTQRSSTPGKNHHNGKQQQQNQRHSTPKRGGGTGGGHGQNKGNGGVPQQLLPDTAVPPPPLMRFGQPPSLLATNIPPPMTQMNSPVPKPQILRHFKVDNFPLTLGSHKLEGGFEVKLGEMQKPKIYIPTVFKIGSNGPQFALSALLHEKPDEATIREAVKELIELIKQQKAEHSRVDPPNKASIPFLKDQGIVLLEKVQESFPDAVYYCEQCDYHISNILHARTHLDPTQDARHADIRTRISMREIVCHSFPVLLPNQLAAIEKMIAEFTAADTPPEGEEPFSMTSYATEMQHKLLEVLTKIPNLEGKQVVLEQFGSVPQGLNLAHSDVNYCLDVCDIDDSDSLDVISAILDTLKEFQTNAEGPKHSDIVLTEGAFPRISFTLNATPVRDVKLVLAWRRQDSVKFSRLLSLYLYHQPKLVVLIRLVRRWARICNMFGAPTGLNKHGFDLMVIHFLQQKNKLTILHELQVFKVDSEDLLTEEFTEKAKNLIGIDEKKPFNVAELFVEFFRYYSVHRNEVVQIVQQATFLRKETKWNNKVFQIIDPIRNENVVSYSKHFQPYFFNCILLTFIYYAVPRNKDGPIIETTVYQKLQESPRKKKKRDRETKENGAVRALGADQTPGKMDEHERRWKAEGKGEEEDAADFVMKKAEEALAQSTKKKRKRSRSKKTAVDSDDDGEETEPKEQEEREPLTLKNFPHLVCDGYPIAEFQPKHAEVNDPTTLQYGRDAIYRIRRRFTKPSHFTDEMRQAIVDNAKNILVCGADEEEGKAQPAQASLSVNSTKTLVVTSDAEETPVIETEKEQTVLPGVWELNVAGEEDVVEQAPTKLLQSSATTPQHCSSVPSVSAITTHFEDLTVGTSDHRPTIADTTDGEESSALPDDFVFPPMDKVIILEEASTQEDDKDTDAVVTERICFEEFFVKIEDEKIIQQHMKEAEAWSPDDFDYSFDKLENYTRGYMPDVKCQHCDSNKHDSDNCPQMKVPDIEEISYERPESEWQAMDEAIEAYYQKAKVNEDRRDGIMKYVKKIENNLAGSLQGARLEVFGSLENGFGGANSDADICFRFESDTPPPEKDAKEVVKMINDTLKSKMKHFYCQAILGAKVPIVKFTAKVSKELSFEGDISYYNTLALSNTRMLKAYTEWAPDRLPQLGLWVKHWAKACDIGDASKGSLSSYSYIIMMIHYLQNCEPPVLPRLQEDFKTPETEREENGEWDVYFHKEVQEGWSQNKQSVAQLFVGFLDYFSRFDYKTQVIQIRRKKPLLRAEKKWNRPINLEDPFDLKHNLGSGVTAKMFVFILKSIRISRAVFMKPADEEWASNVSAEMLKVCRAGNAPIDRQCHRCHRVGHIADGCPNKFFDRDRKMYNKEKFGNNRNRRESGEQQQPQWLRGGNRERRESFGFCGDQNQNNRRWNEQNGRNGQKEETWRPHSVWDQNWTGFSGQSRSFVNRRTYGGKKDYREFEKRDNHREKETPPHPPSTSSAEAFSPKADFC